MKTLLFIAPVDLLDESSGVTKKVKNQYNVFMKSMKSYLAAFEDNDVVIYEGNECVFRNKNYSKIRLSRLLDLSVFVDENKINNIYIRYMLALPHLIVFLRKVRSKVNKIAVEVPDYPYRKKLIKNKKYMLYGIDIIFNCFLKKMVDYVFVCSKKRNIFGIKSEQLINGTNVNDCLLRNINNENTNCINVLSVSTMGLATAVDRFLIGMAEHKECEKNRVIHLHLVGKGPDLEKYQEIIEKYSLQEDVTQYGYLSGVELKKVFDKCDIGLGALGWHRVNIKDDSTLKSREYGLRGMPIIAENKIDLLDAGYPYVMYLPYDDSSVNMKDVVTFYDKCFLNSDKLAVAQFIRHYFVGRCDINITMQPVIDFFEGV